MTKKIIIILMVLSLFSLFGCNSPADSRQSQEKSSRFIESMDTVMQLSAFGDTRENALDQAVLEIQRLNALFNVEDSNSEIYKLNAAGTSSLSADSFFLVEKSMELYNSTNGLFDITVYPLTQLWGFPSGKNHVPTTDELDLILPRIGMNQITIDAEHSSVLLGKNQAIDLGGIAKGYTSNRIMEIFSENGVKSGMVSLGGNVQCLGYKPDGSEWKVGIQDPWDQNGAIVAIAAVHDAAVITSGGYERYFVDEETGKVYRHILDPRTGFPAESGLASVTIITPDGVLGDGLSTSLYVMGLEQGIQYWRNHSDEFQAVFIDDNGVLYATEGLQNTLTSDSPINYIALKP